MCSTVKKNIGEKRERLPLFVFYPSCKTLGGYYL